MADPHPFESTVPPDLPPDAGQTLPEGASDPLDVGLSVAFGPDSAAPHRRAPAWAACGRCC